MSSFAICQPNLLTTEQLRTHLKTRFPNQNVSQLPRNELLKLFSVYAVPKAQRNNSIKDIDMKPIDGVSLKRENEHKRSRHQTITAPTIETVTNACKKIRLINTDSGTTNTTTTTLTTTKYLPQTNGSSNKRQYESAPMESDAEIRSSASLETKRKKITWP